MPAPKQLYKIQSDDSVLNRIQDQLLAVLNPVLKKLPFVVGGDLVGDSGNQTVVGIQKNPVSDEQPVVNDALVWDGQEWAPTPIGGGGPITLAGDATGPSNANTVERIQGQPISTAAPSSADVLTWDGTQWEAAPASGGTLAGDVTGSAGANTVERIRNFLVAATAPTLNQVLKWDGSQWTPSADATGGPAAPAAWGTEVLWWKLDDASQSGTTPNTAVNYGSAGTATLTGTNQVGAALYTKSPQMQIVCPYQSGAQFYGVGGTSTVGPLTGAGTIPPPTTNITVSAWVMPSSAQNTGLGQAVVMKDSSGGSRLASFEIFFFNGTPYFYLQTSVTGNVQLSPVGPAGVVRTADDLSRPWMLAMTYDGAEVVAYVNGRAIASAPATGTVVYNTGSYAIGRYYDGVVWDVRIASSVRTEAQLMADYKTGMGYITGAGGGFAVLAGDVTGPSSLSVVERIHGRQVLSTLPTTGQVLKWNGTAWAPDTDSGTDGAVFTASSTETLSVGMFVAAGGIDVVRADANDAARVPAIGVVVAVNGPGSYQVRTAGVATSMPGSYITRPLFLGATGYAVSSASGLSNIQTVGIWMGSGRINVNVSPQVFTNP
jgi:hypothetical protein